jgi:hypothetical protein
MTIVKLKKELFVSEIIGCLLYVDFLGWFAYNFRYFVASEFGTKVVLKK